jgi:uncharacterized protein YecA (UPF0149 family)
MSKEDEELYALKLRTSLVRQQMTGAFISGKVKQRTLETIATCDGTAEARRKLTYEQQNTRLSTSRPVGRNELCPCGSTPRKKFKRCCGR